ncbi:hypothetical protein [Yersinia enterocolitica]|uniref:hypothetical protein n=1 Tax=Yersinia enterocolitica TaxID=630 RepID=UPI001CA52A1D|nr:hypothetical protein [Yersinia enterocolitica]MBW5835172.1 hypothetical protein [Yersinia enterocolitica]
MNKINIYWLIRNHIDSLKEGNSTNLSGSDLWLHFILPVIISFLVCLFFKVMPSSVVGIMVNFGSITTALLMSAVVMVYDQKSKIIEKLEKEQETTNVVDKIATYRRSIALYKELCQNICFAILTSIIIVIMSAILSFYDAKMTIAIYQYFFIVVSFICYSLFISTMITFLMILKRFSIILDN